MQPVIHSGLAKSHTSTLRTHVYSSHPEHPYLGTPYANPVPQKAVRALARDRGEGQSARAMAYANLHKHLFPGVALSKFVPRGLKTALHAVIRGGAKPDMTIPARTLDQVRSSVGDGNRALCNRVSASPGRYGYYGVEIS